MRYYGRLGIKSLTLTLEVKDNVITVVVVKVDSILYNTDNKEETKELIQVILVKIRIKDNIKILYKEIITTLNPKL